MSAELAEALIRSIPNPDKEDIGNLCASLTHFDPVHYLPNELMLQVLSYGSPADLLNCSTVSRAWRETSQDEKLWRGCFAREGWVVDTAKIKAVEEAASNINKLSSVRQSKLGLQRRISHKRPHGEAFSEAGTPRSDASNLAPTASSLRANVSRDSSDDEMDSVDVLSPNGTLQRVSGQPSAATPSISQDALMKFSSPNHQRDPGYIKISPTIFRDEYAQKVSWPYLYKQRRRLEKNWETGRHIPFQLPNPDHPNEGHKECVYTIQHNRNHLVSGSRDKTIRVWDLRTLRLKEPVLHGHTASVLCLQFDDRPEQDIIVSGGSDAFVIVWKFSTGKIIKKITKAHDESVLNLRFDDRYIVTCSKDKTIKVWNRHAIHKNDAVLPTHVLNSTTNLFDKHDLIREYSLINTITGHGAAVNAVMIHKDTIVSASGDRTVKSWDIDTGRPKKTYASHTKGIACVQFDGRRIVSGSSDNTVRIYDAVHTSEIACLTGHGQLVRTVQARFGDLATVTDEELLQQSKNADDAFHAAIRNGMTPAAGTRSGPRNAGSTRPEDMMAFGAAIPPGGGGNRWAKIVSGSYDETVIIWKRDRDGNWVPKHRLSQLQHQQATRARAAQAPQLAASLQNLHAGPLQPTQQQIYHQAVQSLQWPGGVPPPINAPQPALPATAS